MKKYIMIAIQVAFVFNILLWPGSSAILAASDSGSVNDVIPTTKSVLTIPGDDSQSFNEPLVIIPEQYRSTKLQRDVSSGATTVYFTPQDENTSTTVLFLYNTSNADATVELQTFTQSGSLFINTSILVPAQSLVRICGDTVSTISATWQNAILVNFTTFSTYAKMTLPSGVKAEGYVVWNSGNTYDPLQVAPTLKIRFFKDLSFTTTVYFTPQDENTSTTVLFLYNTRNADATVELQTFTQSGSLFINTSILVPAQSLVRICGDTVSTISATWQNAILVNFTTFSTYAKMTLPPGVKAEGYVVWNSGDTYDPLQVAPALEIGFIPDPVTALTPWLKLLLD